MKPSVCNLSTTDANFESSFATEVASTSSSFTSSNSQTSVAANRLVVSGGGIEFMRAWNERVYGIPPEQVIGSSIKTRFELRDGKPVLVRLPELNFIDDKEGKPVGINSHIGRRPIAACVLPQMEVEL